jgi:hypothetical protein
MIILMPDIQKSRSSKPPPHRTTRREIQGVQSTGPNETPPVKLLGGEVTRTGNLPLTGGTHCEVWTGQWVKGGGVEKVRLRIIMSTPLTWPFVGGLENTSNTSVAREGAQG